MDSTFEFEKKRNTPVRYNRNLWIQTIQAMKRIDEIRQARKVRFHKQRMANAHKVRQSAAAKELEKKQGSHGNTNGQEETQGKKNYKNATKDQTQPRCQS